jgi:programmed cell death protein 5
MSDEYDQELQELLRRKAVEQQRKVLEEQQRKAELEAKKEAILRVILTPEARQRLANVKLVKPEIAEAIENQLIALAQAGRIQAPLTDEELKEILAQLTSQTKKDFKITIKERGWK